MYAERERMANEISFLRGCFIHWNDQDLSEELFRANTPMLRSEQVGPAGGLEQELKAPS